MATMVGKYAAKKLMAGQLEKFKKKDVAGPYDPYYTRIQDPRRPGKTKKVKKQIPDYIPEHDAVILAKARRRAYLLDMCLFNFLGTRFGWSSVIGLIPAVGDVIEVFFALMLFRECSSVEGGLGTATRIHMLFNIIVDFAVGLIPFVGDLADAAYKCNTKNVRLLEEHLDKKYKSPELKKRQKEEARKSGLAEYPPATVIEDFTDEDDGRIPAREQQHNRVDHGPRRPEKARLSKGRSDAPPHRSGSGRGWFSGGSRPRPNDVEMGGRRPSRR